MKLRTQLQYYLTVRGMTASALARAAKVPRQNISNWLMNQKPKDVEQVKRVADVLGVNLDHLLFGEGVTPSEQVIKGRFEISIKRLGD
jgi:transcriptional regulator with XRE-family HTH domain